MRILYVTAICALLSACAGGETLRNADGSNLQIGPTRAISGAYAFTVPDISQPVQTAGRAINDMRPYQMIKAQHPELFSAKSGARSDLLTLANSVNARVNSSINFRDDNADRWEVLTGGGDGDCDDYAVTKLAEMLSAGAPRHALRLVVANVKQTGQWHLMLAVDVPGRGTWFMDNNSQNLLDASTARARYTLWFMENPASARMELVV